MTIPSRTITTVLAASAVVFGGAVAPAVAASAPQVTCTKSSLYTVAAANSDAYDATVPTLHCFSTSADYSRYLSGKNQLAVVTAGVKGTGRKLTITGPTCVGDNDNSGITHMPYGWLRKSKSIQVIDNSCVPNYYGDPEYDGGAQGCAASCSPILAMGSIDFPKVGF